MIRQTVLLVLSLCALFSCTSESNPFEQAEPSLTPTVFYPDNVSRNGIQWNNAFSDNGDQIFYTVQGKTRSYLVTQHWEGDDYGPVIPIEFDSTALHSDVMLDKTGKHMVFMSTMAHPETGNTDFNLWQSSFENNEWTAPTPFSKVTSGPGNESYPCLTDQGDLYFAVARDGSRNSDIYVLRKGTEEAEPLPAPINSDKFEGDAFIDPQENFIIFAAFDRPDGQGLSDLYISFQENGAWTEPKNMGFNSSGYDGSPFVTRDGKYLVFTSSRNSPGNNSYFNHYIMRFDMNDYR